MCKKIYDLKLKRINEMVMFNVETFLMKQHLNLYCSLGDFRNMTSQFKAATPDTNHLFS